MIKGLFIVISIFIGLLSVSSQELSFYYPLVKGELVEHTSYTLDYNEEHEQASWVVYFSGVHAGVERKDAFKVDHLVSSGSATLKDYAGSNYDRGHLAPAADMNVSILSMQESFFMSNMSPQLPGFNRGIWKKLESLVRAWGQAANSENDVIVTGPLLNESCGSIGDNKVTVPCSYYKIYADLNTGKAIGFILGNESSSADLSSFAVSIDEIEIVSGIDFFPMMHNEKEENMESEWILSDWDWEAKPIATSKKPSVNSESIQCKGITGSGKQCSRTAGESGFCWQHK